MSALSISSLALWRDRQGALSMPRVAALALAIAPALWFLARALVWGLGPRPITAAIHHSGLWSVRLLAVTLAVTPLIAALRKPRWNPARRILGVAVFAWALAHLVLFWADKSFDLVVVATEIVKRVYLLIGFVALALLAALAATSTDRAISRLGTTAWRRLHLLVYAIVLLGLLHFFLQSKADVSEPTIMAGLILWLVLLRAPKKLGLSLSPLFLVAAGLAAGLLTALGEALYFHLKVNAPFADILLDADLDFSDGLRPCWWPVAASLLAALALAAYRLVGGKSLPMAQRLRAALS